MSATWPIKSARKTGSGCYKSFPRLPDRGCRLALGPICPNFRQSFDRARLPGQPHSHANRLTYCTYPLTPAPPNYCTQWHIACFIPGNLCSLEFCSPWGPRRPKPLPPSSPHPAPRPAARFYQRIRAYNDPAVFISLRDEKEALAEAEALASKDAAALPLYGVPVAVKDNIDAQGLPTTAACPAFAYSPAQDSTAVAKLRAAGAIIIGKTNLDQFA